MSRDAVDVARRNDLAQFLKAQRARLQPEDVGLTGGGRRRVRGLRRHEVADLAGVSVTWYTWLEQARDIQASPHALDAVARALCLDDDAWAHMRRLGAPQWSRPEGAVPEPGPELVGLLEDLTPVPAVLFTNTYDIVGWNRPHARLLVDPGLYHPARRNALWIFFTNPTMKTRTLNRSAARDDLVAQFRAEAANWPGDPRFASVTQALIEASEEFQLAWNSQQVRHFTVQCVDVEHPKVGVVRTRVLKIRPLHAPQLTLVIHRPADDESRAKVITLLDDADDTQPAAVGADVN